MSVVPRSIYQAARHPEVQVFVDVLVDLMNGVHNIGYWEDHDASAGGGTMWDELERAIRALDANVTRLKI